ncbi:MAG TPA: glycosyl hydrolase [Chthoniobacter sp.]|nr:glycosyl hydrolase [Chthoniobacter sp.]
MKIPRFITRLTVFIALLGSGVSHLGAATVAPTDNVSAPYMGVYDWSPTSIGINNSAYTASWLYRSRLWIEEFEATDSWANLSGPNWLLTPAASWLRKNPGGSYVLSVGMLPGSGSTPLAGTSLAKGAAGAYNSYFTTLAQNLVAHGLADNTVIRLGWEFNGNWYPWKVTHANGSGFDDTPANFAAYWQQIVMSMRTVAGALHLKFCLCGAITWTAYGVGDAYPGDAYVDYVGIDVYDRSYSTNPATYPYPDNDNAADILQRQKNAWSIISGTANNGFGVWKNIAVAHSKPMAIPEWGLVAAYDGSGGLDDTYFVQQMYNLIQDPTNNVAFHVYFDVNVAGDRSMHHQISSQPSGVATDFPKAAALFRQLFAIRPLPMNKDIGTVGKVGGSNAVAVSGGGMGCLVGDWSDNFHLAARTAASTDNFIVKITALTGGSSQQTGAMLRQGTGTDDPYAAVFYANGQCVFQTRGAKGAPATISGNSVAASLPFWLKMSRQGNVVTGFQSADGLNWNCVGSQTVIMTGTNYVGLAVSSGSQASLSGAWMDNVGNLDINTAKTNSINGAVVLGDTDLLGVTKTGTWTSSTNVGYATPTPPYYGPDYLCASGTSGNSVRFSPSVPASGRWDVYACWPAQAKAADNTPVSVKYSPDTAQLTVNQTAGTCLWKYLGTYNFQAGTTGSISIGNSGADGLVLANAVMLVPVPSSP